MASGLFRRACVAAACALLSAPAFAQQPTGYVPLTGIQRVHWIVDSTVGVRSLGIGFPAAAWQNAIDSPAEWKQTAHGFGQRYMAREADVAISSAIEAGAGALWGEDPRYFPCAPSRMRSRIGCAIKAAFLAPRADGHLAPAWGRYAGNVFNNVIENRWLPPTARTRSQTTWRAAEGMLGRITGNLWDEFWPDIRKRMKR